MSEELPPDAQRVSQRPRRGFVGWTAWCACAVPMTALFLAGIGKAIDVVAFERGLGDWTVIPASARMPIALTIPNLEVLLSVAWLVGIRRHCAAAGACVLLVLLSSLYAVQLTLTEPPDCHCFGLIDAYFHGRQRAGSLLVRNGVLLGLLCAGTAVAMIRERRE